MVRMQLPFFLFASVKAPIQSEAMASSIGTAPSKVSWTIEILDEKSEIKVLRVAFDGESNHVCTVA
jgi:hypothetical protein